MIPDKKKAQKNLVDFLNREAKNKGLEKLATQLGVSYWTLHSWRVKRRFPDLPVLRLVESKCRVKIL